MRADLETAGELLSEQDTGDFTQALQGEIELTLKELIEALQRNLKKKKKSGGGGKCDCEPPLLPGSAELKLLRSMQLRVNRRTIQVDKARTKDPTADVLKKEMGKISTIQKAVAEMALELAEQF